MPDIIAFYLPQYHPIPENDKWYGKGFTEWTNVAKARPLYRGHYQPHIPADLGFYDLRLAETRRAQAKMAADAGVTAFCYWNYWFGGGKQLLERPLWDVYNDSEIQLPFCIAWANHSWEKKQWNQSGHNEIIMEQKYLGKEDYEAYFRTYLPIFRDRRYYKVDGRLFFIVYAPLASEEVSVFIETWRRLAKQEGLGDFYFVAKDMSYEFKDKILALGFDAVFEDNTLDIHHNLSYFHKGMLLLERKILRKPTVFKYKDAIKYMVSDKCKDEKIIPVVAPNWDHSPRSANNAMILEDCDPKYFEMLLERTIEIVRSKPKDKQIIILKSWNEWGEGNYCEPDTRYGDGYLQALKKALVPTEHK